MKLLAAAGSGWRLASLPVRGAWVEISCHGSRAKFFPSLPVRGAWVEMSICMEDSFTPTVAPRAGSVG